MGLLTKIKRMEKPRRGLLAKAEAMLAARGIDENALEEAFEKKSEKRYNANDTVSFDSDYLAAVEASENPVIDEDSADSFTGDDSSGLFSAWAKENNYNMCGIFVENYGYFVMCDMFGFEAKTAVTSIASSDFWNGTLEFTGEWEIFTEGDMNIVPFYQLFSEKDKEKIKKVCVLPRNLCGRHAIVLFASSKEVKGLTLPSPLPPEPQNEDFINAVKKSLREFKSPYANRKLVEKHLSEGYLRYSASCFILSVKLAIENIVAKCETANTDIRNTVYETIYNSITSEIQKKFMSPNCITKGIEGEIKIAIFSNGKVEENLLKLQLDPVLEEILGEEAKGAILISSGVSDSFEEAKQFLF